MNEIKGDAKSVRQLLSGAKYGIDYYQREYRWETKHIKELLDDLGTKFLENYDETDERNAVEEYGHYFLGSIIISDRQGQKFIIDGQQRLTSLTLLLIHLYHQLVDEEHKKQIVDLVFSQKFGKRSFNLDVEERTPCLESLYLGKPFDDTGQPESVVNINSRFKDIREHFPSELTGAALPYFADWLIENVHLVEITAYSDEDAYTIFETMNDRGLNLTPTDMLKGYLLANMSDVDERARASKVWKARIHELQQIDKEADAEAIKSWLRSQHAETTRERKAGAQPKDFDLIGTEFHRWVRDRQQHLGLKRSGDFVSFLDHDFAFYSRQYARMRAAAETLTLGFEEVYYNAQFEFTLQYPLILAPLRMSDSDEEIQRKIRVTATYVDILIARRVWNYKSIDYNTLQYGTFSAMKEIRGKGAEETAALLAKRLASDDVVGFPDNGFQLTGNNGRQIHRLLARMTDHVEIASGRQSRYQEYILRKGKNGYDIEHIWANHPERHADEFAHGSDFSNYRNRFGDLLLLPKTFNQSYGDRPYKEKREQYLKHNILAQSLHPRAYELDPGFRRFIQESGLAFKSHENFKKTELDARQDLYRKLAEIVWHPDRLRTEAVSPPTPLVSPAEET